MNQKDVIRLAREAGLHGMPESCHVTIEALQIFAELVEASVAEACAAFIEPLGDWCGGHGEPRAPTPEVCATALRARYE